MLGSLYAIVMGPATLAVPQAPLSLATFSFPGFLGGVAVLGGLEAARHVLERRQTQRSDNRHISAEYQQQRRSGNPGQHHCHDGKHTGLEQIQILPCLQIG